MLSVQHYEVNMGIKYICDFCDVEATGYHEELKNGKIICKNCMEHLQNRTWRLAEEPTVYEKAKKELEEKTKQLSKEKEEFMKELETAIETKCAELNAETVKNYPYTAKMLGK